MEKWVLVLALWFCLGAMMETIWTIFYRPTKALVRLDKAYCGFWWPRLYLVAAVLGYFAFLFVGFYGALFWMPHSWGYIDEYGDFTPLQGMVAATLAFISLASIGLFETHARNAVKIQEEIPAWTKTLADVDRLIRNVRNVQGMISAFNEDVDRSSESVHKTNKAYLLELAQTLQYGISGMIEEAVDQERSRCEESAKALLQSAEDKARVAQKAAQNRIAAAKIAIVEATLEAIWARPAPPIVESLPVSGSTNWLIVAPSAVRARWSALGKIFSVLNVKRGLEGEDLLITDVSLAIRDAPGMRLPSELTVVAEYRGGTHAGATELVATLEGKQVDFATAATYTMDLDGICAAFFVAHILPTYGRFWHALYGMDYSILIERSDLVRWILQHDIDVRLDDRDSNAQFRDRPGLRIKLEDGAFIAAALGAGLTTNLIDFSVRLANGRITSVMADEVVKSNSGVLY